MSLAVFAIDHTSGKRGLFKSPTQSIKLLQHPMSLTICVADMNKKLCNLLCIMSSPALVRAYICIMISLCNVCINTHVIVVCLFWSFWSCADQWRMMRWRWSMTSTFHPAASRLLSLGSQTPRPNGPSTHSHSICLSSERVILALWGYGRRLSDFR